MPKMKTTGTGKIRRRQAGLNHFLGKKASSRKRRLARPETLHPGDEARINRMLGR